MYKNYNQNATKQIKIKAKRGRKSTEQVAAKRNTCPFSSRYFILLYIDDDLPIWQEQQQTVEGRKKQQSDH